MAIVPSRVNVAQVAVLLARDTDSGGVSIKNRGANPVFLGDSTVADTTGYQLDPGEAIGVDLSQEDLWAIATTGTNTLHVLRVGA